jgi:hypothetical protein
MCSWDDLTAVDVQSSVRCYLSGFEQVLELGSDRHCSVWCFVVLVRTSPVVVLRGAGDGPGVELMLMLCLVLLCSCC